MTSALLELSVAARIAARNFGRKLRGALEPEPDLLAFESSLERAIAALSGATIRSHRWLTLPATEAPWRDTGIALKPGNEVTYFAAGRVYASRPLDIWVAPKNQIWARVGEKGKIISSSRDSNTIASEEGGPLFLGNYFPNDWRDPSGNRLQDDAVYKTVSGQTRIVVVEWNTSAREGLKDLLRQGDPTGAIEAEIARMERSQPAPEGWSYLWHLGEAEIFNADTSADGAPSIRCEVEGDVGILQKDVDFPLEADSEISWSWTVDALPEDTGYVCPLPNWKHREYHVVVRSGPEGLGEFTSQRRNLYRDYQQYMSHLAPTPTRIVRVWLIANSVFQRQPGRCNFSNIRLHQSTAELQVL